MGGERCCDSLRRVCVPTFADAQTRLLLARGHRQECDATLLMQASSDFPLPILIDQVLAMPDADAK